MEHPGVGAFFLHVAAKKPPARALLAPEERGVDDRLPPGVDGDEGLIFVVFGYGALDDAPHLGLHERGGVVHDRRHGGPHVAVHVAGGLFGKKRADLRAVEFDRAVGELREAREPVAGDGLFKARGFPECVGALPEAFRRRNEFAPGGNLRRLRGLHRDAARLHLGDEVDAAKREEEERIRVDRFRELVDHRRDVLAGKHVVGAGTPHPDRGPVCGKEFDPERFGRLRHVGREFLRGELRDDQRHLRQAVDERLDRILRNGRERELHRVEGIVIAFDAGLHDAAVRLEAKRLHLPLVGIGFAARNAAAHVEPGEGFEPFSPPPGGAVGVLGHGACPLWLCSVVFLPRAAPAGIPRG